MDKERFCKVWARSGGARGEAIFAEMATRYDEPHRYYHRSRHIDDCLSRMDRATPTLGASDSVELAIWFHDVVYDIGAADNERRSADWFAERAAGALAPALIDEVDGYIMSTTHREAPPTDGAKFVVDVDLSGLGMSPQMFWRDGDNIRLECGALSDAQYAHGQGKFLRMLLQRERIFHTPFFHDWCEAQARRNIEEALTHYARIAE